MATLNEFGKYYPCSQGTLIPEGDESIPAAPGDIIETQWTIDYDISPRKAAEAIRDVLLTKEDYPEFVLHYIKIETRKITVQFSHAPPGGGVSGYYLTQDGKITRDPRIAAGPLPAWAIILLVLGAITLFTALQLRWWRGYLWTKPRPMGDAVITALDNRTKKGIANVRIFVDGNYVGRTGTGGSIKVTKLVEGPHTFAGEVLGGYWPPDTVQQSVIRDQTISVTIVYNPDDEPEPTHGYVEVHTHPISGKVWVGGKDEGMAPIGPLLKEPGTYSIVYGAVDGYFTPKPDTATIQRGATTVIIGYYTTPQEEDGRWYEKYLKYALIGGGIIIGAAVIVPELIRSIARRGEK